MRDKLYSYVLPQLLFVLFSKFGLSEEEIGFECIREKRYLRVEFTVEKYGIKIYWYEEPDCYREVQEMTNGTRGTSPTEENFASMSPGTS